MRLVLVAKTTSTVTYSFAIPDREQVPRGWTRSSLDSAWLWQLKAQQIDELVTAGRGVDTDDHSKLRSLHLYPPALPSLDDQIRILRKNLIDGRGFEVLRGLPVDDIGEATATGAMLALSAHLGPLRLQNAAGDLVGHVRNTGARSDDPNVRLYQTSERQTFHTDSADVVGLLSLSSALEGGESLVMRAETAYHAVAERHPELVDELFAPVATDRRGETPDGLDPWFTIPVLTWWDDKLTVKYQRQYINSARRFADAPKPSTSQVAALDAFDETCNDPVLHAPMTLEVGDIQFVHNHSILHDRNGFVDDPARPRHLVRTWMSVADDRPLHPIFEQRFGSIVPGDRGGIVV